MAFVLVSFWAVQERFLRFCSLTEVFCDALVTVIPKTLIFGFWSPSPFLLLSENWRNFSRLLRATCHKRLEKGMSKMGSSGGGSRYRGSPPRRSFGRSRRGHVVVGEIFP